MSKDPSALHFYHQYTLPDIPPIVLHLSFQSLNQPDTAPKPQRAD